MGNVLQAAQGQNPARQAMIAGGIPKETPACTINKVCGSGLKAIALGADGVLIAGCHLGDCHYVSGNHRTAKRVPFLRNLLGYVGINPDRLRLDWVSSAEAPKFAKVTADFVQTVRKLGPISAELNGGSKAPSTAEQSEGVAA